jgi:hypothetical protein
VTTVATATDLGLQAAAQAVPQGAPARRGQIVRLGYVDDLGFFVNDSDEDGRHDLCTGTSAGTEGERERVSVRRSHRHAPLSLSVLVPRAGQMRSRLAMAHSATPWRPC